MLLEFARVAGQMDADAGMGRDSESGQLTSAYVADDVKHAHVARARALRKEAGQWLAKRGLYSKVQIADFSDSAAPNVPADVAAGAADVMQAQAEAAVGFPPPAPQREVTVGRSAIEFLQSVLPWREARADGAANRDGETREIIFVFGS